MRLETRFVQVPNDPSHINAINNLAAVWGWTVQSIQVTDSKISYEGDSRGWVSDYGVHIEREIITEHTNYASITYQRDLDSPKYAQLCALESAYNDCDSRDYLTSEESARLNTASDASYKEERKYKLLAICTGLVFFPLTLPLAIYFYKRGDNAYDRYPDIYNLNAANRSRREEAKNKILNQARML